MWKSQNIYWGERMNDAFDEFILAHYDITYWLYFRDRVYIVNCGYMYVCIHIKRAYDDSFRAICEIREQWNQIVLIFCQQFIQYVNFDFNFYIIVKASQTIQLMYLTSVVMFILLGIYLFKYIVYFLLYLHFCRDDFLLNLIIKWMLHD